MRPCVLPTEQPLASTSRPSLACHPRSLAQQTRGIGCTRVHRRLAAHRGWTAPREPIAACCSVVQAKGEVEYDVAIAEFPAPSAGAFRPDKRSFSEEHRIRGYEVNPSQEATIVTVANLLQEAAGNHAVGMWGRTDEGFASLPNMKDLIFVMTRLQVRMYEYPKWGDIVSVETYFTEEGRLAFRRDWKLVHAATGKLLGVEGPPQVARLSDMDMNGHINNVTYLAWTLESIPEAVYTGCKLHEIELDFKAECKAGNTIEAHCNPLPAESDEAGGDLKFLHMLQWCNGSECAELVRARTTWRPHASRNGGNGVHSA
ncbi:Oleoyl-acyl carrier protein thioesterase 2, chloroplastic [Tetrabaena socialis]|uniref:Acyl-[acyl-carrier-protein] hydrolase n=1 Tax=Tetrabaena socialis TaxID=47790 RepID=A0A2J7ZWI3_9CHLO|nr:Oleoyl-acyl carrier protein thioesterase 2, chloroplastic [Tetrabaena socialis]|eukprot:PNH04637.1 Oleoyl-acyl carrier protein thioesterase 2, chloroplastic [Tetrabaena socialis]